MRNNDQTSPQYQAAVRNIMSLLGQRRVDEAVSACLALSRSNPESNDALLLLGKARQMQGRFEDMLQLVEAALAREPANVGLQLQYASACRFCGHHDRAVVQLEAVEQAAQNDAALLQDVAQLYVLARKYDAAHRCYCRAVDLDRKNPQFLSNLAASFVAVGKLQLAEETYSRVINLSRDNFGAWHNRSTLRKQTEDSNHVRELEKALSKLSSTDQGTTQLCYALAKEHEDLGEDERSFSYLKRGADSRRRQLRYDVESEVSVMTRIAEIFDASYSENVKIAPERRGPIFVLGLPRSGSTLVERIISSHSQVVSMGEIPDFALALTRLGRSSDRRQSLEASVDIDPDELGRSYIRSVKTYGADAPYFVDKTPVNFLYIGLIAKALPGASIIHVRRHPVDACLSMYRALFGTGYPFSYDLDDLARYYIAYDALMRHWQTIFPEVILDVSYEDIVETQDVLSRRVIAHCGLDWEQSCLEFESNSAPVATASAAQVRKPIYRDALARWRRFENQLTPLIESLQEGGIAVEKR